MGIFNIFKKKEQPLTAEQKLNRLWELWEIGDLNPPYENLMTYEAEVNNGGHSQYFFNTANCGDIKADIDIILPILPEPLHSNLSRAYNAFAAQKDICDDDNEELFEECDNVFYKNEQLLIDILMMYANNLFR